MPPMQVGPSSKRQAPWRRGPERTTVIKTSAAAPLSRSIDPSRSSLVTQASTPSNSPRSTFSDRCSASTAPPSLRDPPGNPAVAPEPGLSMQSFGVWTCSQAGPQPKETEGLKEMSCSSAPRMDGCGVHQANRRCSAMCSAS